MDFDSKVKITVIHSGRKTLSIQLKPGEIIARAPLGMKEKDIYGFIEQKRPWIEKHLSSLMQQQKALENLPPFTQSEITSMAEKTRKIIAERVSYYAPKIGVTYNKITIRCQRTRWGSCSSSGNLNFNCLLSLFPRDIIDSVVVHELCHRRYMNHSPHFYAEIEKVFPDYHRCHSWLNKNGAVQLMRLPEKKVK